MVQALRVCRQFSFLEPYDRDYNVNFRRFPGNYCSWRKRWTICAKQRMNRTVGTLRTDNVVFTLILVFVVYIFAALTFFPALALG